MKKTIGILLLTACLSWMALAGTAHAGDVKLSDLDGIYRLKNTGAPSYAAFDEGGEDVSYDSAKKEFVPLHEETKNDIPPQICPLPETSPSPFGKPKIAIIIDDTGVDLKRSERAVTQLDKAITLSYLPYSHHIDEQVKAAAAHGHEVMLHLPWEPNRGSADPGPHHLSVNMTAEQLKKNLLANLDGFHGYAGINNHMGSRFSQYHAGLDIVMKEIRKRGVFFLDSRTTPNSLAEKTARDHKVPTTHRDVFLDHIEEKKAVEAALAEVEKVARHKGSAVAIGHPKDMTLDALEAWIPTLAAKGFELEPMSAVLRYRQDEALKNVARADPKK